jgi:hypothetical protein
MASVNASTIHRRGSHVDFICGWSAGCLETVILYPQNKLIFRQQLYAIPANEAATQVRFNHKYKYIFCVFFITIFLAKKRRMETFISWIIATINEKNHLKINYVWNV